MKKLLTIFIIFLTLSCKSQKLVRPLNWTWGDISITSGLVITGFGFDTYGQWRSPYFWAPVGVGGSLVIVGLFDKKNRH